MTPLEMKELLLKTANDISSTPNVELNQVQRVQKREVVEALEELAERIIV